MRTSTKWGVGWVVVSVGLGVIAVVSASASSGGNDCYDNPYPCQTTTVPPTTEPPPTTVPPTTEPPKDPPNCFDIEPIGPGCIPEPPPPIDPPAPPVTATPVQTG
jgi:hypothetical protein